MRIFILLMLVVGLFPALAAPEDANLLPNPNLLRLGADGAPEGWRRCRTETALATDREDKPEHLPSSLRVTAETEGEGGHSFVSQPLDDVKQNTLYVASGFLKGDVPEGAYLQVKLYAEEDGRMREFRRMTVGHNTGDWRRARLEFNSDGAERMMVLARVDLSKEVAGKSFWFAGLDLREKDIRAIDLRREGRDAEVLPEIIERLPHPDRPGRFAVDADGRRVTIRRFYGEPTRLLVGQAFGVHPDRAYRMTLETRGTGQLEFEWDRDKGIRARAVEDWAPRKLSFLTCPDARTRRYETVLPPTGADRIWLNIHTRYYTVWGDCRLESLTMEPIDPPQADRPIALEPDSGQTVTVSRLPVADARAVRGFTGAPVDGTTRSRHYNYGVQEYGEGPAGQAVYYNFNANDGFHVDFPEAFRIDYVALRGGCYTRMYTDAESYDEAGGATRLWEFMHRPTPSDGQRFAARRYETFPQSASFETPVTADNLSFFDTFGGSLADLGFYRVERRPMREDGEAWGLAAEPVTLPEPKDVYDARNIRLALDQRKDAEGERLLALRKGRPASLLLRKGEKARFFTPPLDERTGLSSITLDFNVVGSEPLRLMAIVHDPLDPRRDIHCAAFRLDGAGRYSIELDFLDQIVEAGRPVWFTLEADADRALAGATARLHFVDAEAALAEALAWRKFILKCLYLRISEPRAWMYYKQGRTREQVFRHHGPERGRYLAELFATIDDCYGMAPEDDEVRQYREWCYVGALDERSVPPDPPEPEPGVPEWAHYSRLGWLAMRDIAQRWFEQRQVPTGEFGGRINDDSCFFQQLLDFPRLRDDGLTPEMKDAARRFNELTHSKTMRHGVSYRGFDALHAYEEGMNHLALMAQWFYGDPLYIESLMESAASIEKFTILTPDGRRHFRRDHQGAADVADPGPLDRDFGRRALTLHTVMQLADYNRSPRALELASQWADTWNRYMVPGNYATVVDVESGEVVSADQADPLRDHGHASVHCWLADLTGDARFVEPLASALRSGTHGSRTRGHAADLYNLGVFDDWEDEELVRLAEDAPYLDGYLSGDPNTLALERVLGAPERSTGRYLSTLYHVQRWPDMMDPDKQYTDRVWFRLMSSVARVYLGGAAQRNDLFPSHAVSWDGFGQDYAAAVLVNRRDRLRALVYNFRDEPLEGGMTVWRLDHGVYSVMIGADTNGDHTMDTVRSETEMELAKARRVTVSLPPRQTTVIEARLVEPLPSIFTRPDLAVASREMSHQNGTVSGVLHNIGSAAAEDVRIVVLDADGREIGATTVEYIEAPLDLIPRRVDFAIPVTGTPRTVQVDPDNAIPEIYEGNNSALVNP